MIEINLIYISEIKINLILKKQEIYIINNINKSNYSQNK